MRGLIFVLILSSTGALYAQRDRVPARIDNARRVVVTGTAHPLAVSTQDLGTVEPGFSMSGLILHFQQTDSQRESLRQFLDELQNPSSSNFHKFLTPEQYADRFGVSPSDMAKVLSWIESQGFTVHQVARGRTWLMFQGTGEKVTSAFGTEIHRYRARGRVHFANTSDISIPEALSGIVVGLEGLNDFYPEPQMRLKPDMTSASGAHTLAPDDLATIYDIAQLYKNGIDGSGQKIAIIGGSSMSVPDVAAFRTRFNLPSKIPQSILVPGYQDIAPNPSWPLAETDLDLEWAGAVARNADLVHVYALNAFVALAYAIDQNLAPIVSLSAGGCEAQESKAVLAIYQQIAQQANAQGMTWVNASGDSGAAGCDPDASVVAQNGLAVQFPAAIPEVTGVGGTEFNELAGNGVYWNSQNDANNASALSYIPEMAWNESIFSLLAGGGGASVFYPKPAWQSGPGVPNDGARDVPDVALSAAGHDGYAINLSGSPAVAFGTSASAPVFAGVLALVNQFLSSTGTQSVSKLGNINSVLYRLAQNRSSAFHDIALGGNNVPCAPGSPGCSGNTLGYNAGPGYDLATGLGSPDVYNLVNQWKTLAPNNSQVVVSLSQNPVYQHAPNQSGLSWTVTVALTEEGGVPTTLSDFTVNGQSALSTYFPQTAITALGTLSTTFGFATLDVPATVVLGFAGVDTSGTQWTRAVSVPFLGPPPNPTITGLANSASFEHAFAPGMYTSVFGTNLAATTQQAAAVPLEAYLGGFSAAINGIPCPLFYVSSTQVNLQIPYEVHPGAANLAISNGVGTAIFSLQILAAAPGIFQDGTNSLVPNPSGNRGQTYTLFMTGDGVVTPSVADGSTPRAAVPPVPNLPVTVAVGGVNAPVQFIGIPSWAIGETQINFQVPPTAPLGPQQVRVTVGTASSSPVNFTVMP